MLRRLRLCPSFARRLVASSILVVAARGARADTPPSVDLRSFQPSTDPGATLFLEPASTPGAGNWNVAGWLSFADRPLVLRDAGGAVAGRLLTSQTSFDATFDIGLGKRVAVGAALPIVLYQTGDDNAATRQVLGTTRPPATAIGDAALTGKLSLVRMGDLGGFGLSALGRVTLPTSPGDSSVGDKAVTSEVRALAEFRLVAVSVEATAGFRVRTSEQMFAGKTWGDDVPWGAGLFVRPQAFGIDKKGHWTWGLEAHGWLPAGPDAPFTSVAQSPAYGGATARYAFGRFNDFSVLAGVEGALDQAAGAAPVRGVLAIGWAPRVHDQDGDGIPDDVDECVGLAEDKDGFQDEDGCPELDNDDDGILDPDDACPNVPGVESDDPKKNGCPDDDFDKDGIPNEQDACPKKKGPPSDDPKKNGCPIPKDSDGDGIPDKQDACPKVPGVADPDPKKNGCPPDKDGDGVSDADDACPAVAGVPSADPAKNGCPVADRDHDGIADADDKCPGEPETYNGFKDEDGCPEPGAGRVPLAKVTEAAGAPPAIALRTAITFAPPGEASGGKSAGEKKAEDKVATGADKPPAEKAAAGGEKTTTPGDKPKAEGPAGDKTAGDKPAVNGVPRVDLDRPGLASVRSVAQVLNAHEHWSVTVAVKPEGPRELDAARERALLEAFVAATGRRDAATLVPWPKGTSAGAGGGLVAVTLVAPPTPAKAP